MLAREQNATYEFNFFLLPSSFILIQLHSPHSTLHTPPFLLPPSYFLLVQQFLFHHLSEQAITEILDVAFALVDAL